jgi:predicted nuclease with TOPRIM domain
MSGEMVAGAGAGLLGLAWYVRKLMTNIVEESTASSRAAAERDIIEQLREELDRLSKQNKLLAEELNGLQSSMVELNHEIGGLRVENRALKDEIGRLHDEINRLRASTSTFGEPD